MLFRKQKQGSIKRLSCQLRLKDNIFLAEYRSLICPIEFSLKQVDTYGSILPIELQNIECSTLDEQYLRDLLVDSLKLTFVYQPLMDTLKQQSEHCRNHFSFKSVMRILFRGQFYKFIENSENQLKILVNNRTTEANVKIIMAALLVSILKKLNMEDITTSLLFFSLESALYDPEQLAIPLDNQKIIKVLRKLERIIKPVQFKIWLQGVKNSKDFKGQIEAHQFLYLCSLTQKKFNNGLGSIIFRPKIESLFKNINTNMKGIQFQQRELLKENKEERRVVRGLSFVDIRSKQISFSKQILKEFRLRDPSKYKRPNTALLRRHVSSFTNHKDQANDNLKISISVLAQKPNISGFSKKVKSKIGKKGNQKTEAKLRLFS